MFPQWYVQMNIDANLCDDGMEYIQTLTIVQRNIQVCMQIMCCVNLHTSYDKNIGDNCLY